MDLQKSNNELRECKDRIQVLTQEENRLQKIIQEGDKERTRLTKELNQVNIPLTTFDFLFSLQVKNLIYIFSF